MGPVEIPELAGPGRLFIWRCPALRGRRLKEGDARLLREAGVDLVICLLEPEELERYGGSLEGLRAALTREGLRSLSWPTEDLGVPSEAEMRRRLARLSALLEAGRCVLVHCMAGLGRAGTVAAGLLAWRGMPPADAMALVRWARPGAIQADVQEEMVRAVFREVDG